MTQTNPITPPHNVIPFTVILLLLAGGCSTLELTSRWAEKPIPLDETADIWAGNTKSLRSERLTIGFANDTNFVYLLFSTSDRDLTRMVLAQGLTVWFDPMGGRSKDFGVHFPLGLYSGRSAGSGNRIDPLSALKGNTAFSELEVIQPGEEERHRLPALSPDGIQARVKNGQTSFVYELRVPYATSEQIPYSIRAKWGGTIGVGFETAAPERQPSASGGAGGGRGRGGRGGRASTGSDSPGEQEPLEPLKDWVKVQLISPDSVQVR